ncbi:hypothetical protein CSKR_110788 [Clonorchis sinensis]|uniref:Uncharacterized protein n=1 Tax=Clonorchis sinensis TaxID=79923 RepID=A0A419QB65_CLOSI|nr:hypothetical protein CSKR_110788 [Clonorchis sinensis]
MPSCHPTKGSMTGILPGCPSLDRGSREGVAEFRTDTASPLAVRRCYGQEVHPARDWPNDWSAFWSSIKVSSDWPKFWTQLPIMLQYPPNTGCQWRIQKASKFPGCYRRMHFICDALHMFLIWFWALIHVNTFGSGFGGNSSLLGSDRELSRGNTVITPGPLSALALATPCVSLCGFLVATSREVSPTRLAYMSYGIPGDYNQQGPYNAAGYAGRNGLADARQMGGATMTMSPYGAAAGSRIPRSQGASREPSPTRSVSGYQQPVYNTQYSSFRQRGRPSISTMSDYGDSVDTRVRFQPEVDPWTVNVEPPTASEVYNCICILKRHHSTATYA